MPTGAMTVSGGRAGARAAGGPLTSRCCPGAINHRADRTRDNFSEQVLRRR